MVSDKIFIKGSEILIKINYKKKLPDENENIEYKTAGNKLPFVVLSIILAKIKTITQPEFE